MNANTVRCVRAMSTVALTLLAAAAGDGPARAEGTGFFAAAKLDAQSGEQIYRQICQGCHMPDGQGATGAGAYPAFAKNPDLASTHFMAQTILHGRRNMPAFSAKHAGGFFFPLPSLTSAQVAAVINYVRTHFGNHYTDVITVAEVDGLDGSP